MGELPNVAPYESCIVCFKGDTTTAVAFRGPAEWLIAGLWRLGVPKEQAEATILQLAHDEYECDYGQVPPGEMQNVVLVCEDCASKAELTAAPIGGEITQYRAPP